MKIHRTAAFLLPADRRGPCEECGAPGRVLVVLIGPTRAPPRADGGFVYPEEALGDRVACPRPECRAAAATKLITRKPEAPPCS